MTKNQHIRHLSIASIIGLLSACQTGFSINPCQSEAWQKACHPEALSGQETPGTKISAPLTKAPSLELPVSSPVPTPTATPSPINTALPTKSTPENPSPPASPQPLESAPASNEKTTTAPTEFKLVLGPSWYEFAGPNESTQLIFFIKGAQGQVLNPADFKLRWESDHPDLFTVSDTGMVSTTGIANSGFTTIRVTDIDSGKTTSMEVVIGRGGGGGTSTPVVVDNTLTLVLPTFNQRFVPGQAIPLEASFTTSDSQVANGVKVVFYDENNVIIGESLAPLSQGNNTYQATAQWTGSALGSHNVKAELLDSKGVVLATSVSQAIEVSVFGITSFYVNTTTDKIYQINLPDGTTTDQTDIPGAGPGFPSPGGTIDAIAKHPTNNFIYYEGRGSGNNKLYYWAPAEGTTATAHHYVGDVLETISGTRRNVSMMGFSPANQKLYGFGVTGGVGQLLDININSGAGTLMTLAPIGATTVPTSSGGDLAVNKEGVIYLSTSNRIYEIKLTSDTTASIELLGNLVRKDNGATVGSVSSIGFNALNQGYIMTSSGSKIRLYLFDPTVMNSAVEVLNLTDQAGNPLNGVTSSGGDMTGAHF